VVFPGSNCDHDAWHVAREVLGQDAVYLWHKDRDLKGADCVIVPGGFSYGDYLRCGAIARLSPVMDEIAAFAKKGGPVLGICNGFQILTEAGLLPGALMRNRSLKFVCDDVHLKVEASKAVFTRRYGAGEVLKMPVAHAEGNYYVDAEELRRLEGEGRVVLRYCSADGRVDPASNPNGAVANIAGVCNEAGNVVGLMPHPERASEQVLGSVDGRRMFEALL
ncbi:MAG: phosphoribosylformylglycinamidine synthase subunit PurQ, partial [Myxococcales bacterium]